ncbi:hypothetical protein [Halobellus limi]|uniref:Uncharacterized protein n=1 Tax=Halobellus limi TaxID=699433 RepID=A0A1H5SMP3_9EURY|nr:hypothetical protein [Halobellus limi]QCC47544.1 hypothetical protein DV707_07640 [Halobellus limi]SEF51849.1 hypothetical protein SAMN04488133_0017 [Halobellus limi]
MTCDRCGRPTSRRRHCVDCARDLRQEERARLEDASLLDFETIKRCRDCGSTSDDVDGDYLEGNPGVWLCDGCRPDSDVLVTDGGRVLPNARALEGGDSA